MEAGRRLAGPAFRDMLLTGEGASPARRFWPSPTAWSNLPRKWGRVDGRIGLEGMRSRVSWFNRGVTWVRTAGAVSTLWTFLKSPVAALYLWGPGLTLWGLIAGLREDIATPYLLTSCILIFGGLNWCFLIGSNMRDRFRDRYQKLSIVYDRAIPSCRADVTFNDGLHSMCFRLQVNNVTTTKISGCEGWLNSVDKFPHISSAKLYWVDSPTPAMSVDLIKTIPRFLQICRITDKGEVRVATEKEYWPIDSLRSFHPGNTYVFNIAVKGNDKAETTSYSVELNWTGNWTTSEMRAISLS
jgi:hypothetical protein